MSVPGSSRKRSFQPSRLIPSVFRRKVHVLGLLGTTDIEEGEDDSKWMATDFVALRQLIGARDDLSQWFCGTSIRTNAGFILGDPASDRIVFDPPPFETVLDPEVLIMEFGLAVNRTAASLSSKDSLVIVLVGHGDDKDKSLIVGDAEHNSHFRKEQLEACLRDTKGEIVVINTACYSGAWESKYWTLLSAAGPKQEAMAIAQSGSGETRGGFFTMSLLAEWATEFGVRPPYPGSVEISVDNNHEAHSHRGAQRPHDFGPESTTTPSHPPKRSLAAVRDWIHKFRDDIGRTYTKADITFIPCSDKPHALPFASLITSKAPFHRLLCIPPSPNETAHATVSQRSASASRTTPSQAHHTQLTAQDREELMNLAQEYQQFIPVATASEIPTMGRVWRIVYGPSRGKAPLSDKHQSELLSVLRNRVRKRKLALSIATGLGWAVTVDVLGEPNRERLQQQSYYSLQQEAEASGCLVSCLVIRETSIAKWGVAAGWLAKVWEAEGRLKVAKEDWDNVIMGSGFQI